MRLIDADELITMQLHDENDRPVGPRFVPAEFIENAPTVDAVPLEDYRSMEQTVHKLTQAIAEAEPKHGRWIPSDKGDCTYICSECGFVRDAYVLEEKAYCPNCGAAMQSTMGQVKHGHWIKYGPPLFSEWECSECGERHTGNDLPDKCPHCKAKMDEQQEVE